MDTKNRSLVPTRQAVEDKLRAEPVLLVWRRLIDLAVDEAKRVRFGEPTDGAIMARWWIETEDADGAKHREFRATFERACVFLGLDAVAERQKLLREIDAALVHGLQAYAGKRLELRRRAVLATAGCPVELSKTYALLLVSQLEIEDTAGINRSDPPARKQKAAA